jgi:membrane-bound lytic murein transglycosylase B
MRRAVFLIFLVMMTAPALAQGDAGFSRFLAGLKAEAIASGVSANAYDALTNNLMPDPRVPRLVETQPEFTTPVWDYIETRVNRARIDRGRAAIERNGPLFSAIGQRTGVDPYLLGAIWGIETDYGAVLSNTNLIRPIVRSLATVTYQQRTRYNEDKADFFAALSSL